MVECKTCGYKMILPNIKLISNDYRMNGDYCSRSCMDERRASLPPFKDPKAPWNQVHEVHEVHEVPETVVEPPLPVEQDAIDQGFNILFGKKPEDEEEINPFNNLFG